MATVADGNDESRWLRQSGFHMIATIAEIELKSISAIVVAAIAGGWFESDRGSDRMETAGI